MISISTNVVALICTLLIPVAVALITKNVTNDKIKAVATMVLAGVVVLIQRNRADNGTAVISAQAAFDWTITTAVAIASYVGLWKPITNVNDRLLPHKGL